MRKQRRGISLLFYITNIDRTKAFDSIDILLKICFCVQLQFKLSIVSSVLDSRKVAVPCFLSFLINIVANCRQKF